MANERKTENIVRDHFGKFRNIIIEEQRSDFAKVVKLLKNASKQGNKHGLPEFIIHINENANLLIVVECKGDISKHQSQSLDKFADYAVDGVLLYASFLSREYDVLAIAVSGENIKELKVSHFLHLKGAASAVSKFSNELLSPEDYLAGYVSSPEKFNQDYSKLIAFSKELNDKLQTIKIKTSLRSLLISGVLIALDDHAFEVSYKLHTSPEVLANALTETVINQLRKANLHNKKLDNLRNAYNFIRTHTSLSGEKGVLSEIIDDIDKNINVFIKTHRYFDVLGQFYIEFLRYANSDKGLGIVLTPPHTTQLFCELAGVNKDSVVLDNCTGTGGFLISAMSKMIEDSKGNKTKENEIKERQLIGIEWQDDIFALACSNMYIHQDGKSNIIHGSCFNEEIMLEVMKFKPTIGLLNPPYPNLPTDPFELEFVLNNLAMLQPNSTCIAILPINSLLAARGRDYELKRQIMEEHTLEAVLSLPNELFHNSKVGVVTAAMIVTAHKPHPTNKETYFGYWKDDGFEKRKHKGRIDLQNRWEAIKYMWLHSFTNRKAIEGLSLNRKVNAEDEWCVEAYMEIDYTTISKEDLLKEMKKYIIYNILSGEI